MNEKIIEGKYLLFEMPYVVKVLNAGVKIVPYLGINI